MIIYNKDKKLKVTAGAYNSIFKGLGWSTQNPVEEHKHSNSSEMKLPDPDEELDLEEENVHEDDDISERPLSDLSLAELKALAKQHGINTEGMLKKDIRSALREAMSEGE